jgi:NAD(P)-dependent dehydrogenase (short-subunit alcohol dehydrogenase family)
VDLLQALAAARGCSAAQLALAWLLDQGPHIVPIPTMYTPFDLSGRGVVVTGGNGGIGLGMARALLAAGRQGGDLGLQRRQDRAARPRWPKAAAMPAACTPSCATSATRRRSTPRSPPAVAALGSVHACFANAGVSSKGVPLTDMTLEEFRRVQRINVDGVFLTFRAAARHMAEHGQGGSLVATASTAALEGAARNSHYGASKGAVTSFVRALAVELARHKASASTASCRAGSSPT